MDNHGLNRPQESPTKNVPVPQRRRTVSFSENISSRGSVDKEDSLEPDPFNCRHESFQEQRRRKHSGYSFTSDLPERALKVRAVELKMKENDTERNNSIVSEHVIARNQLVQRQSTNGGKPMSLDSERRSTAITVNTSTPSMYSGRSTLLIRMRHSTYAALRFARFQNLSQKLWDHSDQLWAKIISWFLLGMLLWALLYMIFDDKVGTSGDLFRLLVLILAAYLMGLMTELLGLPGLLGMLVTGVVLRNVHFYHPASGAYKDLTCTLKQLATTVGMVRAGMRLFPDALYVALHCHHGLRLTALGMVPSFLEATVTTVISYFALNYPSIWAVCLGFLLCPNSPSVITPPMQKLMDAGYGEEKHIGAMVHGAAGLDVAFSVSIFDICLSLLFHRRDLHPLQKLAVGSLDVFADFAGGVVIGLVAGLLPIQDNNLAVWKRTIAVMTGGMLAIVAGPRVAIPGTGPLSCIVTAFVASMLWKLQMPLSSSCKVNDIIQGMWVVLCPMLFVFTGSDVDISLLSWNDAAWMAGIILVTVIVRLLGCFLVLCGGEFNCKEMLFVGLIFQGKATNQAALAPQILYAAWNSQDPDDELRAIEAISMGVLSILICTPIAHLGGKLLGPYLLTKKRPAHSSRTSIDSTQQNV